MDTPRPHTIVLRGGYTEGGAEHDEGIAGAAGIYPGMNVTMTSDNERQGRHTWKPGGSDYVGTGTGDTTQAGPITVVREDRNLGLTVDDVYTNGENLMLHHAKPGDVFLALVLSGETVNKGDGLTFNTAGKAVVDATNAPMIAMEDSDGALAEDTLMKMRKL